MNKSSFLSIIPSVDEQMKNKYFTVSSHKYMFLENKWGIEGNFYVSFVLFLFLTDLWSKLESRFSLVFE